jgi:hypothetical protein
MHRGIFVYTCDAAGGEDRVVLLPGTYVAILVLGGVLVITWTYLNILKWKLSTWGKTPIIWRKTSANKYSPK